MDDLIVNTDVIVTIDEYVLVELLVNGKNGELYRALWYFQDSLEPYEWEL
jgi:hypothetical protein